ncbi:hypothetical protein ACFL0D_05355, partial [Thermoproteota archaeon]
HKPAVGDWTFAYPETEISQKDYVEMAEMGTLVKDFTYSPRIVGNRLRPPIGRKCTVDMVRYHLGIHGWTATPSTIQAIVEAVRTKAAEAKGQYLMEEPEFMKMVQEKGFELMPREPIKNSLTYLALISEDV